MFGSCMICRWVWNLISAGSSFHFMWCFNCILTNLNELDTQVTCGTLGLSTATVKLLSADGEEHVACSLGTGPVDSAYKAVNLIVKVGYTQNYFSTLPEFPFHFEKLCLHQILEQGSKLDSSLSLHFLDFFFCLPTSFLPQLPFCLVRGNVTVELFTVDCY
jgi:hypothetical protein